MRRLSAAAALDSAPLLWAVLPCAALLVSCGRGAAAPDPAPAVPERPRFAVESDVVFDPAAVAPYAGRHQEIYDHIDSHQHEHTEHIRRWLRQPSVSAQNHGIAEMAELLRGDLEQLGFAEAEVIPTSGHPGVWGHYDAGAARTLLVYMMYDVQPVEPADWERPPFAAELVQRDIGTVVLARGATNQKGPERAFLNAVSAIRAVTGTLPINLMILAEGEEELGSPHYPELVDRLAARLAAADGVFFPYNSQDKNGEIRMALGVKGILYFEAEARGGAWGGPTRSEIHGSYKALVDSPVWRLVQALATLTTRDGNTIAIDGYYDRVRGPAPEDEPLINFLTENWNGEEMRGLLAVERFIDGANGEEAVLRELHELTLNIDGIWGGYTGPGVKTILPHQATAKLDSRLPPGVDPDEALALVRAHLDRHGFNDVVLRKLSGYPAAQTTVDAPLVRSAIAVFNKWARVAEVAPRIAGSAPFYVFTERLGLPLVFNGLGHGSGAHAPNEYMVIEPAPGSRVAGLRDIEKGYVDLLYALAGEAAGSARQGK